jgi:predicted ATPase/DNA-binding SARP family transcriptional activator
MNGRARLRVTLLSAFQASRGEVAVIVPGARLQGLLVRLALAGGRAVESGVLVAAIWPEELPAGPAHALQSLVTRLRRALGSAGDVAQVAGGYRLEVDPADVDVLRFEQLAVAGRERLRAGDTQAAAVLLSEALALWGDQPGAEPAAVASVAPAAATQLAHTSVEAVVDLAAAELSLGRAEAATDRLTSLLAEQPVNERLAGVLMDALAAQGRQAEALALYERIREALADVLGSDPGTALRERHLRLLRAEPLTSSADPTSNGPSNLPAPLTSFIGRDDDLTRVNALLTGGRLVTVLGPGGAGKTRLAVEAARRRRHEYRDGTWMIDLSSVTEPAKITTAVLAGVGRRSGTIFETHQWAGDDELDVLVEQLGNGECLLLVDNCEHLIDAVAHLVAGLLSRCPRLCVLATSREPLAVDGEALVPLGPLPLPEPDDDVEQALQVASVQLFAERSAAVRAGFTIDASTLSEVVRVVRALDGLPLALELAAARLRTLSLPELADGLSDRFGLLTTGSRTAPPRHRTLHAVIAWSWDLLSRRERTIAERVSILPGGVTKDSATAVCAGTDVTPGEIPELLAALVDRSLLQLASAPGRYRMLETLREYGRERLVESGELGTVRDLAADYFAELAAHQDSRLHGPGQLAAMTVISDEYDNVLAALRRWCDVGDATRAITFALTLTWYWQMAGRNPDATYWLGEALAVPGEPTLARDCAHMVLLLSRADLRPGASDEEAAEEENQMRELATRLLASPELPSRYGVYGPFLLAFLREEKTALVVFERLADGGDVWVSGLAHLFRAEFGNGGELGTTRADVEAALVCFQQVGDRWGRAAALPLRAQLRQYDGDLDGALADLRETRSLVDEFGSLSLIDEVDGDLRWADLHLRRDEIYLAMTMLASARERALHASSQRLLARVHARAAGFRVRLGDLEQARELLDDAKRRLHGDSTSSSDQVRTLISSVRTSLCLELGDLTGAETMLAKAYAAALECRDLPLLSLVAVNAAAVADAHGLHRTSAVLLGAASRLRGAHDRTDKQIRDLSDRAQVALGEEAFAAAYGSGWELGTTAAVTEVGLAAVDPSRRSSGIRLPGSGRPVEGER